MTIHPRSRRRTRFVFSAVAATLFACMEPPANAADPAAPETVEAAAAAPTLQIRAVVLDERGIPVKDAVVVTSAGGRAVTDADGVAHLEIQSVSSDDALLRVTAVASSDGLSYIGSASLPDLSARAPGATLDAGVITISRGDDCDPAWLPTFGGQPGVLGEISALTIFDDGSGAGPALYAGGSFTAAGGVAASNIVKWDGAAWTPLGSGVNSSVIALIVYDDGSGAGPALYAGGDFDTAGGIATNAIARWDGAAWSPLGSGVNAQVWTLTIFDDGSGAGPALYAGGNFSIAGGDAANNIAKWDGAAWSPLGSGTNNLVIALAVYDDDSGAGPALYAGGRFTTAGGVAASRIARWDGAAWSPLGSGVSGAEPLNVHDLTVFDDGSGAGPALYAGGQFTSAGGVAANRIARWDGAVWSPLGSGMNDSVSALAVYDDGSGAGPALYAGGHFDTAGGVAANAIARWDGAAWSPLEIGVSSNTSPGVDDLIIFDDGSGAGPALYAGGTFATAGGMAASDIARWDGAAWSTLGSGVNAVVHALAVHDDGSGAGPSLYAGGDFIGAGGVAASRIAKWDGVAWSPLGGGMTDSVIALAVYDDRSGAGPALYAGGWFTTAGGVAANRIAKWDAAAWSPLGDGMNNVVWTLTVFDDGSGAGPALYAGGQFTSAGGVAAIGVAKWDGAVWSDVEGGVNAVVRALAVYDDGSGAGPALYVGGNFTAAGGVAASRIAKWDGAAWSPLGSGLNNSVSALAVYDDGSGAGPALYAGGFFTTAGGVAASRIARWDGASWSTLGSGMNDVVVALTVYDDGAGPALYAGGGFTTAGGVAASRIARWSGAAWSSLGGGVSDIIPSGVNDLTSFDDGSGAGPALFVGGSFPASVAGDSFIARWQGCPVTAPPCPADRNGDGAVNASDLGLLLKSWGAAPGNPADLNGDEVINASDLGLLLTSWGPC